MNILYENNSIVVCIKPAGISSQKSSGKNMPEILQEITGVAEIYPVHRLDIKTTGIMVYAKTKAAAAYLSGEAEKGMLRKTYSAVVHGIPVPPQGTMEDLLFRDRNKNKTFVVKRERRGVKKAMLEYCTIKTLETQKGTMSLVKINLITGRTHQIRAQFASRKMPVFGDGKYGASDNVPYIALMSSELSFINPEDGKELSFAAPPPDWDILK